MYMATGRNQEKQAEGEGLEKLQRHKGVSPIWAKESFSEWLEFRIKVEKW